MSSVGVLKNPNLSHECKPKYKAMLWSIFDDELNKQLSNCTLATYLGEVSANVAIAEVHKGMCGTHQAKRKMHMWSLWNGFTYFRQWWIKYYVVAKRCE